MADTSPPNFTSSNTQFGRYIQLAVFNDALEGIDLSQLRVKFSIKRTSVQSPNMADIRIYNVKIETALQIQQQFNSVVLQAGYQSNYGVIFKGTIVQVILGREDATTTFVDIIAGDGDLPYNYAYINTSLTAGVTYEQQYQKVLESMKEFGIEAGFSDLSSIPTKLPRGKVLYNSSKNMMKLITDSTNSDWSFQNGQLTVISQNDFLPFPPVVLTSKTGLVGTPQQTSFGINIKCLLNPVISIYGRVQINNASVQALKIDLSQQNSPANIGASLTQDGVYYVQTVEHQGDTRGVEWYSNLICLNVAVSTNPNNPQPVNVYPGNLA